MALAPRWTARGFAALLAGCTEVVTVLEPGISPAPGDAATAPEMSWGDYAAALDVPPCPNGAELFVNTTADELDGGTGIDDPSQAGPALSLVEALWIAANRLGQDNIYFDPEVFPVASPATVLLSSTTQAPPFASPVCIDGRGRGVVVDWNATSAGGGAIWNLGAGDLQIGLTLLRCPYEQVVGEGAQVAGCRYGTNGRQVLAGLRAWAVELSGGLGGPGNVFAGRLGVCANAGVVERSWFGYDPSTEATLDSLVGIDVAGAALAARLLVERNTFATIAVSIVGAGSLTFRDNIVEGGCPQNGIALTDSHGSVIGPGNVIRGCGQAISFLRADGLITRNSIFDNTSGIVFAPSAAPVAPPTIVSATTTQVGGLCAVAGTVELFSDAGDQGESYLGSVVCDGATPWTLGPLSVPSGRNVTATLTDQQSRTSAFSAPVAVP